MIRTRTRLLGRRSSAESRQSVCSLVGSEALRSAYSGGGSQTENGSDGNSQDWEQICELHFGCNLLYLLDCSECYGEFGFIYSCTVHTDDPNKSTTSRRSRMKLY